MKKRAAIFIAVAALAALFCLPQTVSAGHTEFNKDNLIDDGVFINKNTMSEQAIQDFLVSKGSCLASYYDQEPQDYFNYSGNVRAARIIWKAAQDWGLNPQSIIVTIQKEQGLIDGAFEGACGTRAHVAMGMGCPDSGPCPSPSYYGFSRQVYKGTWQLRFNFERSAGNTAWDDDGAVYYFGYMTPGCYARVQGGPVTCYSGDYTLDGTPVHMSNRATASLYSYTPHTYGSPCYCYYGNYNFVHFFTLWFGSLREPAYSYTELSKETFANSGLTERIYLSGVSPGQRIYFRIKVRNTGNVTWQKSGPNPVHMGTASPQDRSSPLVDTGWLGANRPAALQETSVAPSAQGTFIFSVIVPPGNGLRTEDFNLVAEGITWMPDTGLTIQMTIKGSYGWQVVGKGASKSLLNLSPGETVTLGLAAKNTGTATWYKSGRYPLHLGTAHPQDRLSRFTTNTWLGANRPARLQEDSVLPGQTGHFSWTMTVPPGTGSFSEYFNLVAEGITWLPDQNFNFFLTTISDYRWQFVGQGASRDLTTMAVGETATVSITAKNVGQSTWFKTGPYAVHMGTTQPRDRLSPFVTGTWLGANRPAALPVASVAPGQTVTFTWTIRASTPGTFREYSSLVAENITWMNDPLVNHFIVVS